MFLCFIFILLVNLAKSSYGLICYGIAIAQLFCHVEFFLTLIFCQAAISYWPPTLSSESFGGGVCLGMVSTNDGCLQSSIFGQSKIPLSF
jgi:hypothetical protein